MTNNRIDLVCFYQSLVVLIEIGLCAVNNNSEDNVGYVKEIGITLMCQITRNNSEPLPSSVCGRTYVVKAFTRGSNKTSEHCNFEQNVQNDCDVRMKERNKAKKVKDTLLIVY